MRNFYVIYQAEQHIPGSDIYDNAYEIYDTKQDFISSLKTAWTYIHDNVLGNSFKLDNQTLAGEYGDDFHSEIRLEKLIDLDTSEWLI